MCGLGTRRFVPEPSCEPLDPSGSSAGPPSAVPAGQGAPAGVGPESHLPSASARTALWSPGSPGSPQSWSWAQTPPAPLNARARTWTPLLIPRQALPGAGPADRASSRGRGRSSAPKGSWTGALKASSSQMWASTLSTWLSRFSRSHYWEKWCQNTGDRDKASGKACTTLIP